MPELNVPYKLKTDWDTIRGLTHLCVSQFLATPCDKTINAIEFGFWPDGGRLQLWLISDSAYEYAGQAPYTSGLTQRPNYTSYNSSFQVPAWQLLSMLDPKYRHRVTDHAGKPVKQGTGEYADGQSWRNIVDAIGRSLVQLIVEEYKTLFQSVTLAKAYRVTVFEDEDSDLQWKIEITGRGAKVTPTGSATWNGKKARRPS